MLEVLARSMTQLQDMQAKTLQKNLDDDSPEVVKSTATSLPMLTAPEGIATGYSLTRLVGSDSNRYARFVTVLGCLVGKGG